jgi:hypothetical protein
MRWKGEKCIQCFDRKPQGGKTSRGRRLRRDYNIRMDLSEIG